MSWSSAAPTFRSPETAEAYEAFKKAMEVYKRYGHESKSAKIDYKVARTKYESARDHDVWSIIKQTWEIVNNHLVDYFLTSEFNLDADLWSEPAYTIPFSVEILMDQLESLLCRLSTRDPRRCNFIASFPPF